MLCDREPLWRALLPRREVTVHLRGVVPSRNAGNGVERSCRKIDIARRNGAPFAFVGGKQSRAAPAFENGGKLPADIDRLFETRMHADAAGRRTFVRSI